MVIVDQYTGDVLYVENSRTAPGGRRMETLNRAVHTGDVFGLPSKIVMSLTSVLAALQMITGVTMLWKRRCPSRPVPAKKSVRTESAHSDA